METSGQDEYYCNCIHKTHDRWWWRRGLRTVMNLEANGRKGIATHHGIRGA